MIVNKKYAEVAPVFLRVVIGFGFIAHGWAKISRGTSGFEKLLAQTGLPMPHLNAIVIPYLELLGGLAIFIGAFVAIAAVPLIVAMLAAMFTIHIHYGFSSINTVGLTAEGPKFGPPGYEINLLYIAGLGSLILTGAGNFSIDAFRARKRKRVFLGRS